MDEIESLYKKVDGVVLLEIKLSSIMQLFNSFDPAPFHEKELDAAAEEYIVDSVEDFPTKTLFKMIIYLPPELVGTDQAKKIAPEIPVAVPSWPREPDHRPVVPFRQPDSPSPHYFVELS